MVVFWGALARKCRFSCRATSFASGEAPDLFGYSLSNACGEECDVRQAMLTYGKKRHFLFSAGSIPIHNKGEEKKSEDKTSREVLFHFWFCLGIWLPGDDG